MKNLNRRDLCVALTAFAAIGGGIPNAIAEEPCKSLPCPAPVLSHSRIFPYDKLPVHASANGGASRPVILGTLATGEFVEVHETALPPGQMPHPPHRHTHSEFLMIREGKLEVTSDGQTGIVEPGGVIFTASGVLHSLKNVGDVMANYFVVAVGVQHILI
jgi:quercetin dioxygenase-like cupin family protein